LNIFVALSGIIYYYVITISFLTPPIYYKLQNIPCADEFSVHKMNPDIHFVCEAPANVNVHKAECSLSDADSHYFPNNYPCFFKFCITNREQITRNFSILTEKQSTRFKKNWPCPNTLYYMCRVFRV